MYFADYKGAKKLAKHFAILTVVLSFGSQVLGLSLSRLRLLDFFFTSFP